MSLVIIGEVAATARWQKLCRRFRVGLDFYTDDYDRCCSEGHATPDEALHHGFSVERDRTLALLDALPENAWGRLVLDGAS